MGVESRITRSERKGRGLDHFMPWGKRIKTDGHAHLLELARRIGLPLQSACGGKKLCCQCKVIVEETAEPLPSRSGVEREALGVAAQGYHLGRRA